MMLKVLINLFKVVMFLILMMMKIGMVMVVMMMVKFMICLCLLLIMILLLICVFLIRIVWYGFGNFFIVLVNLFIKIEMGVMFVVLLFY